MLDMEMYHFATYIDIFNLVQWNKFVVIWGNSDSLIWDKSASPTT